MGSIPPAQLYWFIDNNRSVTDRARYSTTQIDLRNVQKSVLSFRPSKDDNGHSLTCVAKNPYARYGLNHSINLDIFYAPETSISVQTNGKVFREGDDVQFQCMANANPKWNELQWYHNKEVLYDDVKKGIRIHNTNLLLKNVTNSQSGNYSCVASNVEGKGERKNSIYLQIMPSSMDVQSEIGLGTILGVTVAFIIVLLILSIAIIKFRTCKSRKSPLVSSNECNQDFIHTYSNLKELSSNKTRENSVPHKTQGPATNQGEEQEQGLHYAELAPIPTNWSQKNKIIKTKQKKEQTIYAEIEHDGVGSSLSYSLTGPQLQELTPQFPTSTQHRRKVVTSK